LPVGCWNLSKKLKLVRGVSEKKTLPQGGKKKRTPIKQLISVWALSRVPGKSSGPPRRGARLEN